MKSFILLILFGTVYYLHSKFSDYFNSQDIFLNVEDLYTIKYKTYPYISKNITINSNEKLLLNTLKNSIPEFYSLRLVGGWVRDKLLHKKPKDLDILIDAVNIEELKFIIDNIFVFLAQNNVTNLSDPMLFAKPDNKSYTYGKTNFTIYGQSIDIVIMARERTTVYPYSFTPTQNYTLEAETRDSSVNAIAYNIRTQEIEDPLGGFEDLRLGILRPCVNEFPLGTDYFKVFSVFKTSAKISVKIDKMFKKFIRENIDIIKIYLVQNRNKTCHKFRKITDDFEYSLSAFKLLYDFSIFDIFISTKDLSSYIYKKRYYMNKIFNLALISEFLIKDIKLPKLMISKTQKHYIYKEIFQLAFQNSSQTYFKYDNIPGSQITTSVDINFVNHKAILLISKKYCENIDCTSKILKEVNLNAIDKIIRKNLY